MGLIDPDALASLPVVPVQLYEVALLFLIVLLLWRFPWREYPQGTIAVVVTCSYAIMRFFVEYMRADGHICYGQPDDNAAAVPGAPVLRHVAAAHVEPNRDYAGELTTRFSAQSVVSLAHAPDDLDHWPDENLRRRIPGPQEREPRNPARRNFRAARTERCRQDDADQCGLRHRNADRRAKFSSTGTTSIAGIIVSRAG